MAAQSKKLRVIGKKKELAFPWRNTQRTVRLVLPAYNEEENLGALIETLDACLHEAAVEYEIIVVDDGSSDRTSDVALSYAEKIQLRLERHSKNQGLGATIRDGLRLAAMRSTPDDIIISLDADNTHSPGLIPAMLQAIREGNDIVIASRFQLGAYVRGVPYHRVLLSRWASRLFRLVFPMAGVRDYTCGYRAYRASLLQKAFLKYGNEFIDRDGFECMVDILLKLQSLQPIIRELPLILRYDKKGGASKMNVPRTIFRTLTLMLSRRFFS
jgi:dolichol-phosphate mannosyltransferase